MSREECLDLLGSVSMGRLVLSVDCLPVAKPVFVDVVGDAVIAAVTPGIESEAARRGDVVAIEVDGQVGEGSGTWTVSVTGVASELAADSCLRRRLSSSRLLRAAEAGAALLVVSLVMVGGERTLLGLS